MKPKITYQLAADTVINDPSTNKVSVVGIFQNINLADKNSVFLYFTIISRIEDVDLSEEKRKFRTEICDPNGNKFSEVIADSSNEENTNLNLIARFPLQEFSKKGDYKVNVFIDDEKVDTTNNNFIFRVK